MTRSREEAKYPGDSIQSVEPVGMNKTWRAKGFLVRCQQNEACEGGWGVRSNAHQK